MNRIILISLFGILTFQVMAQEKIVQTAGRDQLGEFAPKFAELNDDILFGEVWSRNDLLSLRDRSLVTLTSLISQGITDSSLTYHLQEAKKNGITRTEISEIYTQAYHIQTAGKIKEKEKILERSQRKEKTPHLQRN